jgi:hypothetical protein
MCLDASLRAFDKDACAARALLAVPTDAKDPRYGDVVRAWSMEGFVPGARETGHDHFFGAFDKFGALVPAHFGDMLAEVVRRAGEHRVQYVELMVSLSSGAAGAIGARVWPGTEPPGPRDFDGLRAQLLADSAWADLAPRATRELDAGEKRMQTALGCGTTRADPGCGVAVRYLFQVSRSGLPARVFASLLAAFEVAKTEPRLVGLNLVSPEDGRIAIRDYALQMQMLDALHATYTARGASPLHVALHAGEITAATLPQGEDDALTFHIRRAVEVGHAERVGHGVDLATEAMPAALLAELASKNVLVETCLSSNAQILEVMGGAHPLARYLGAGVPVALATDDEGVSRSNLTTSSRAPRSSTTSTTTRSR